MAASPRLRPRGALLGGVASRCLLREQDQDQGAFRLLLFEARSRASERGSPASSAIEGRTNAAVRAGFQSRESVKGDSRRSPRRPCCRNREVENVVAGELVLDAAALDPRRTAESISA